MSDERDDLLKEIGDALQVEPSPSFAAGVRTRIASEPAPGRSWMAWFAWGGAAAAVTAGVAIFSIWGRVAFSVPPALTSPVVSKVETPVVAEPAPTVLVAPVARARRLPARAPKAIAATAASSEPFVIVQMDPRTTLGAIWTRVLSVKSSGVATAAAPELQAEWPASVPLPELKELTVAPIVVAAIEIPGVVSQGAVPVIRRVADGARK